MDLDTWHAGGARISIELRWGRHEMLATCRSKWQSFWWIVRQSSCGNAVS
jgi:hypothetical protein